MTARAKQPRVPTAATAGIRHLLSIADVARILDCHPDTVRKLLREGAISTVAYNRRIKFKPADVEALIERVRLGSILDPRRDPRSVN
jgi:excisionase family DNA binding protein